MSENEIKIEEVSNWRSNWKKKSNNKLFSIVGISEINDIIEEAVERSYSPSVQNTNLKKGNYGTDKLQEVREIASPKLVKALKDLFGRENVSSIYFENWEKDIATEIRQTYLDNEINLYTYGNSQKWINMAIKYIFSSDSIDQNNNIFKVCYLPIDSVIQNIACKKRNNGLNVSKLSSAWSKCDDWEEIVSYENDILMAILTKTEYKSRLWWECNNWKSK